MPFDVDLPAEERWRLLSQELGWRLAREAARGVERDETVAGLERRLRAAEAALASERSRLASLQSSRSWRATAPLRRAAESLRNRDGRSAAAPATVLDAGRSRQELFEHRMRAAYEARRLSWPEPTPGTLNEKVWHRRLTDRRPVLKVYCDKVATLENVASRVEQSLLQERLAIVDSAADLSAAVAAEEVVVRVSHGSGGSIVLWDGPESRGHTDETWVRWAFDRGRVPWDRVREGLGAALECDFGWDHLEWGYLDLPRVIVVDRLYRGVDGGLPDDLLLFVFHGRVAMMRRMTDRQHDGPREGACYDRDWNRLPVDFVAAATGSFDPPPQLGLAIEVAEELARDEEFLRVDFLVTDSGLKLSEMTPYPLGGDGRFTTEAADRWLGTLW